MAEMETKVGFSVVPLGAGVDIAPRHGSTPAASAAPSCPHLAGASAPESASSSAASNCPHLATRSGVGLRNRAPDAAGAPGCPHLAAQRGSHATAGSSATAAPAASSGGTCPFAVLPLARNIKRCPLWARVLRAAAKYIAKQVVMRGLKQTVRVVFASQFSKSKRLAAPGGASENDIKN